MCLITEQKKPIILEEDLIVYKKVCMINKLISALVYPFIYELNKLYVVGIVKNKFTRYTTWWDMVVSDRYMLNLSDERNELIVIGKGFHSASKINRLLKNVNDLNRDKFKIMECIIPKSSEVYFDETNLIASNQIKTIKLLTTEEVIKCMSDQYLNK
jgi:hypothetical protein